MENFFFCAVFVDDSPCEVKSSAFLTNIYSIAFPYIVK